MKYLVASGCSFTDECVYPTWATHLSKEMEVEKHNYGLSSSGNGLIAKQAIYGVEKLLTNGVNPADILVAVMWSGQDRHEFFATVGKLREVKASWKKLDIPEHRLGIKNPHNFTDGVGGWVMQSANWPDNYSQVYYETFWTDIAVQIRTYENILRVQHYLEAKGIKYFFSSWCNNTVNKLLNKDLNVSWLYDMIDWSKWLDVEGEYEWCRDNTDLPFSPKESGAPIKHPTTSMHEQFTKRVIVPHLKLRKII